MPFEKDPSEIGALWLKHGAKGPYLTGTINGVAVVCFQNTRKTSDKQPEYRVLKSKPRDGAARSESDDSTPLDDIGF